MKRCVNPGSSVGMLIIKAKSNYSSESILRAVSLGLAGHFESFQNIISLLSNIKPWMMMMVYIIHSLYSSILQTLYISLEPDLYFIFKN